MKCWSCMGEIPTGAVRCPDCEAELEAEPTTDEIEVFRSALAGLEPEIIGEIQDAFEKSESGEDFVNRIMIGDCPACGSSSTGDCENDPDIDDICIARCLSCGQLWCPDCGELFANALSTQHDCPAWDDMDLDDGGFPDDSEFPDDNK